MTLLGVNVDHVATLRQARGASFPNPVEAALVCQKAGADSIVAHLREDRRHIQDTDVQEMKTKLMIKLNLEASIDPGVLKVIMRVRPDCVTFVPEKREEQTTESGLDVVRIKTRMARIVEKMQRKGIEVSLFVDPVKRQIAAAKSVGVQAIEIHTGAYANAQSTKQVEKEVRGIHDAVKYALGLNLKAHVGHGLDYENIGRIAAIRGISEFNIGFSIMAASMFDGMSAAVTRMKQRIHACHPDT